MNRRELLKSIGLVLGGSVSAPVASAFLACRGPKPAAVTWKPRTLTAEQNRLVVALSEAILPATDTPGAAAARVNEFIDLLLSDWLEEEAVERFLAGLAQVESLALAETGNAFLELTPQQQVGLLERLDREAVAARIADDVDGADLPFMGTMKELTLVGYYTSDIGMTQELRLPAITDSFAGCIPLEEVGRSWA